MNIIVAIPKYISRANRSFKVEIIGPDATAGSTLFFSSTIGMKTPATAETNMPPVNDVPIVKASASGL